VSPAGLESPRRIADTAARPGAAPTSSLRRSRPRGIEAFVTAGDCALCPERALPADTVPAPRRALRTARKGWPRRFAAPGRRDGALRDCLPPSPARRWSAGRWTKPARIGLGRSPPDPGARLAIMEGVARPHREAPDRFACYFSIHRSPDPSTPAKDRLTNGTKIAWTPVVEYATSATSIRAPDRPGHDNRGGPHASARTVAELIDAFRRIRDDGSSAASC